MKMIVGENNDEDMKITLMDPNTRSLLKVCINDIQNDASIFQMLRGGTEQDRLGRKALVRSFRADRTLIDT
jgi:DNA gyrase/topoisomerase IV subunit B